MCISLNNYFALEVLSFFFFLITVTASVMSFFFFARLTLLSYYVFFFFHFLDVSLIRRGGKKSGLYYCLSALIASIRTSVKALFNPFSVFFFLVCFSLFILKKLNCRVCVKNYAHVKTITTATRKHTHTQQQQKKKNLRFSFCWTTYGKEVKKGGAA